MIRRMLLVPLDAADPHRLLIDCGRMRCTPSGWVDVEAPGDWCGLQARILLDLPPVG